MENKEFDNILRDKLKGLENSNFNVPDWDRMNDMIDEDSAKDKIFDEQVAQKLNSLSASYYGKPQWNNLYELISSRIERRNKVLISKSSELVICLLLLLTAFNIGYFYTDTKSNQATKQNTTVVSLQKVNQVTATNNAETILNVESSTSIDEFSSTLESSNENTSIQAKNQVQSTESSKTPMTNTAPAQVTKLVPLVAMNTSTNQEKTNELVIALSQAENEKFNSDRILFQDSNIDGLAINAFDNQVALASSTLASPQILNTVVKQNNSYLSLYAHTRINQIKTPYDDIFLVNEYDTYTTSTNFGLKYERDFGKLGTSVSLEYAKVDYGVDISTIQGDFYSDYKKTSLESIGFHFLSMPFDLSYRIFSKNNWNIKAIAGISPDMMIFSDYGLYESNLSYERPEALALSHNVIDKDSELARKNFQDGILDPVGSDNVNETETKPRFNYRNLTENLYFRVRAGLGISKNISPRIAVFSEGLYQYQLQPNRGIGPNSNAINSISINLGARYRLG